MTLSFETTEANLLSALSANDAVIFNVDSTVLGALDDRQLAFAVSAGSSTGLGLDTTTIRSDMYRIPVTPGETYSIEIATAGSFGGTTDEVGVIVNGDNGTPNGLSGSNSWSLLGTSDSTTGSLFQGDFAAGGHNFIYVTISADSVDPGSYTFSVSANPDTVGDDTIVGTPGDDVGLIGFRGDDTIDGGLGTDSVLYQQADDLFTLRLGSAIELEDRSGNEGSDALSDIEVITFADAEFELFRFDDVDALSAEEFASFTEMYIAYFNRAPDAAGLMFWANAFATGTSIETIARLFSESPEAQALYPADASAAAFVEAIYLNVLGRASDPAGAQFWTGVLDNGSVTRDEFVLQVLRGARADAPADATPDFIAQQQADVAYLDNKIDIGIYFSAILGMSNLANATDVMSLYDGSANSITDAVAAADEDFLAASADDGTGEFLIQLVGVIGDPFGPI